MFKLSHTTLIAISGLIWLAVGFFLLPLGVNFLVAALLKENAEAFHPLLISLAPLAGGVEAGALVLVVLGMMIGFLKGRFILSKTVKKGVDHIRSLPNPASLGQVYTLKYYILLGSMFLLGFLARMAPMDVRGLIDVTIGTALIIGAILYFRHALHVRRINTNTSC